MPLNNIFIDSIRGKIGFIVCDTQMLSIDAQCPEVADQLGGTIATHRLRLAHLPAAPVHQIVATQANAHSRAQITNRCFLGGNNAESSRLFFVFTDTAAASRGNRAEFRPMCRPGRRTRGASVRAAQTRPACRSRADGSGSVVDGARE